MNFLRCTGVVSSKSFISSLQMSDRDSSISASQTEGEFEGEMDEELEGEEEKSENGRGSPAPSLSNISSTLRAVIRIKQKYQAMKKRRQEMALGGQCPLTGAPGRTSPKIFTFDGITPTAFSSPSSSIPQRKKRRKKKRVLFPEGGRRRAAPKQDRSRAKYCLYLLFAIVFLQVNK